MRVAVVGTGFGCRVHVPALRAAGFEVIALVGRNRERTKRRASRADVPSACISVGEALAMGVDAITIATPPDTHAALALEAIAGGAHVLCEKPFALQAKEATSMVEAADNAGVVGLVGHEFRFAPEQALVARLLAAGAIGTPRLAVLTQLLALIADPAAAMPEWWFDQTRGGGWLGASGSHAVDRVRHWFGEVRETHGVALGHESRADDSFALRLRTAGGCVVDVVQSAAAWRPAVGMTRVVGTEGSLWIDGSVVMCADATHPDGRAVPVPADLALPSRPSTSADPADRYTHLELGPYTRLCERFGAAIKGGDAGGAATFADGLAVQQILDAVRSAPDT